MKKVLIVSKYFYPDGSIASHRIAGLVDYLPKFGYEPIVLCPDVRSDNCASFDNGLARKIPAGIQVIRTTTRKIHKSRKAKIINNLKYFGSNPKVFTTRILQKISPKFLIYEPPAFVFQAEKSVSHLFVDQNIDLIFATCPPISCLVIGSKLSRRFGVPWVADFRDSINQEWIQSTYRHRSILEKMERRVLRTAAGFTAVSNGIEFELKNKTGKDVQLIRNGFTRVAKPTQYDAGPKNRYEIIYTGTIYPNIQKIERFMAGVDEFVEYAKPTSSEFKFRYFGKSVETLQKCLGSFPKLVPYIEVNGYTNHDFILDLQKRATLLLLLSLPGYSGVPTGKIFEYLATGKPVLCFPGARGEIREILDLSGQGIYVENSFKLKIYLDKSFSGWKNGEKIATEWSFQNIKQFSRKSQTRKLSSYFNSLLPNPQCEQNHFSSKC